MRWISLFSASLGRRGSKAFRPAVDSLPRIELLTGTPVSYAGPDFTLVQGNGPTVYELEGGLRHQVSYGDWLAIGQPADQIRRLSQSQIDAIPVGNTFTSNGWLVKGTNGPTVYEIADGQKHPLTGDAWSALGQPAGSIKMLSPAQLGSISTGSTYNSSSVRPSHNAGQTIDYTIQTWSGGVSANLVVHIDRSPGRFGLMSITGTVVNSNRWTSSRPGLRLDFYRPDCSPASNRYTGATGSMVLDLGVTVPGSGFNAPVTRTVNMNLNIANNVDLASIDVAKTAQTFGG